MPRRLDTLRLFGTILFLFVITVPLYLLTVTISKPERVVIVLAGLFLVSYIWLLL